MATYDISRVDFDPDKHYTSVRMQQGRVLTDDDWNENERIENEDTRRSRVDIVGAFGSPNDGFRIDKSSLRDMSSRIDFDILAGTLYLGGLRLELHEKEPYILQKDWLQQPQISSATGMPVATPTYKDLGSLPNNERFDLVYLEAWQQAISAVEDEALFEPALGGPDTTTRVRNMRQVKIETNIGFEDCADAWKALKDKWHSAHLGTVNQEHECVRDAQLAVAFIPTDPPKDLCNPSVSGGYLGAENQAIRVQLTSDKTFTWGFDNASTLYRATIDTGGKTITLLTDPKDQYHWPLSGQVVEILLQSAVLSNGQKVTALSGKFSKVDKSYDPDTETFTTIDAFTPTSGQDFVYVRIWNRGDDLTSDAEISFVPNVGKPLIHTGIQVTFSGTEFVAEDFWVIAARPETPQQVIPWALKVGNGLPPLGVRRFFAPLAVIHWTLVNEQTVHGEIIHDCRKKFNPLTDLECCCTYTVGDGMNSKGDFDSIQEAIDNLPPSGGKICVLPGTHQANVHIEGQEQIHIYGCGERSVVHPEDKREMDGKPIFFITHSKKIHLEKMLLWTTEGTAIHLEDDPQLPSSEDITVHDNHIFAFTHGIHIAVKNEQPGNKDIRILDNEVSIFDHARGRSAIFCLADGAIIARNRCAVIPLNREPNSPDSPDLPKPPGTVFDPCADRIKLYAKGNKTKLPDVVAETRYYLKATLARWAQFRFQYLSWGGIQIGNSSDRVRVLDNDVTGGRGNGITFGHLPPLPDIVGTPTEQAAGTLFYETPYKPLTNAYYSKKSGNQFNIAGDIRDDRATHFPALSEIQIEDNRIRGMGLSGIGVVAFFDRETMGLAIRVDSLDIYRNHIHQCARQTPQDIPTKMLSEVGFGGIALADCKRAVIRENLIEDNGYSWQQPVCGVFIGYGEKIDVSDNRILNNGRPISRKSDAAVGALQSGVRGGIVIRMALESAFVEIKDLFLGEESGLEALIFDGQPAVKVHGNTVFQPLGQALFVMALGPVSVLGNQFTTQETMASKLLARVFNPEARVQWNIEDIASTLAATVFILNFGGAKDILTHLLSSQLFNSGVTGNEQAQHALNYQLGKNDRNIAELAQLWPSGQVMFSNNQTMLDFRRPEANLAVCSQVIVSADDVSFDNNQSECATLTRRRQVTTDKLNKAFALADLLVVNTALAGASVRSNNNRFQEGLSQFEKTFKYSIPWSLVSLGLMNTAMGNQSTHCLSVNALKKDRYLVNALNLVWHVEPGRACPKGNLCDLSNRDCQG